MGKVKRAIFVPKGLPALGLYTFIKTLNYIPGPGVRFAFTGPLGLWLLYKYRFAGVSLARRCFPDVLLKSFFTSRGHVKDLMMRHCHASKMCNLGYQV